MLQTKAQLPLLDYAAQCGFWKLPVDVIHKLMRQDLEMDVDPEKSRAEHVFACIRRILKCSEKAAADIMEITLDNTELSPDEAMLALPQAMDIIDDSDRKKVTDFLAEKQEAKTEMNTVKELLKKIRKPAKGKKRKAVQIDHCVSCTPEAANIYFPHEATVYRDEFNGRWRVWYGKGQKRWNQSVSWGWEKSDWQCVEELLKVTWEHHTGLTGEACPITF